MINIRPEVLEAFKKYIEENSDQSMSDVIDENYLNFIKLFPSDKISELNLENYCLGNPDDYPDSFCWWLEHGLTSSVGKYTPGNSNRHFIYWDKKDKQYKKNVTLSHLSDEDAMLEVAKLHAYVANLSPKENLDLLDNDRELAINAGVPNNLALGNARKLRLTQIYHPEYLVNINSLAHMKSYLLFLGATKAEIKDLKEQPYKTAFLLRQYYLKLNDLLLDLGGLSINTFGKLWYTDIFDSLLNDIWGDSSDSQNIKQSQCVEAYLNIPLNQILYGPPGTGKTYKIQQIATKYVEENFNEEAYLANIVKNISWLDVIIYAVLDIEKPCKLAEILKNRFYKAKLGSGKVNSAHIDQVLVTRAIRNPTNLDRNESTYPRRDPLIFDRNMSNEWFIVDSEKEQITEYVAEYTNIIQQINNPSSLNGTESQNRYEIVTFHQSFSYEDFVEGIRAETTEDKQIKYEVKSGIFKEICDKARKEPNKKFAIFIDEINRGNIANIFGELITLIEPDKRQGCQNELSITLPYSKTLFSVPQNLDIYGTMNTSDHSLTKLDLALRRRFEFVELLPKYDQLNSINVRFDENKSINIGEMLQIMNDRIEVLLGRDYLIGHSYFLELKKYEGKEQEQKLADIFKNKIIPLLQEYFFEDWERIQWVLNDQNKKNDNFKFIKLMKDNNDKDYLTKLFGNLSELNQIPDRRYQINKDAFEEVEAYIQILNAKEFE